MIKDIRYGGLTASPSDYESPDGDLDMAINLIPKDGALRPVRAPKVVGSLQQGERLLFVHTINDNTRHLIIRKDATLYYATAADAERTPIADYADDVSCAATGNVLCVFGPSVFDHYVFLRGKYRPFSTDDYSVTILFGLDASMRTQSKVIPRVIKDAAGASVATWQNVTRHDFSYKHQGFLFPCSLSKGETYRIKVVRKTATSSMYFRVTLYDADGNAKGYNAGLVGGDFQVTPQYDVTNIYVSFQSGKQSGPTWMGNFDGTVVIDKRQEVIQQEGTYLYNATSQTNEQLLAVANTILSSSRDANRFALPFFVRYGFRMITGDIITVSPPILMEPTTGVTPLVELSDIKSSGDLYYDATVTAKAYDAQLMYRVKDVEKMRRLMQMEDLVDTLVIAVSDPVYLYKQGATDEECAQGVYVTTGLTPDNKSYAIDGVKNVADQAGTYLALPHFDNYEERLTAASAFKIIKEIKRDEIRVGGNFTPVPLDDQVLQGLAGNTSLLPDNTENLSSYASSYVMAYNQREHWAGVVESLFPGFHPDAMCGFVDEHTETETNYRVGIEQRESEALQYAVFGKTSTASANKRWFFHPNAKAVELAVFETGVKRFYKLQAHPFLKGAYYFGDADSAVIDNEGGLSLPRAVITQSRPNMLYVSMQGNPIMVEQRIRVGDGDLYAAAANTRPISRGQFGQSPLYLFASDGVWAVEVASDGRYAVRQPVSRDVCINIQSITPIDDAVLFATERGIMALSGSDTRCISDPINAEDPFSITSLGVMPPNIAEYLGGATNGAMLTGVVSLHVFLHSCRIIYDYLHQLLVVFNPAYAYAYVYSLEEKKWTTRLSDIDYAVASYPEALAVDASSAIVNFSAPSTDDVSKGVIVTRPIKLDDPDVLKTITAVLQRGRIRMGSVKAILYGSIDLFSWVRVYSSQDHYLRGLRGTPYKYFRFVLLCDMQPDESIYGATVQYEARRTNRLR